jgi:protein arginine phosphatase
MSKVVFICTGNTCRSPMAEYLLRAMLGDESGWSVESAGTHALDGMPASPESVQVLAEDEGIDLAPHRSRMIGEAIVAEADLLVCMTAGHRADILRYFPSAQGKTFVLSDFAVEQDLGGVPDPVGRSLAVYRRTKDMIKMLLPDLILFMKGMS